MSWANFVKDYKIKSKRGSGGRNIEIHCPFCGHLDKAMHLGLSLESPVWGCWRNRSEHSGYHPKRLIQKLLNMSEDEAEAITTHYFGSDLPPPLLKDRKIDFTPVNLPTEFMQFGNYQTDDYNILQRQFIKYLEGRGFDPAQVAYRYDLRWAVSTQFKYRIIVPIKRHKQVYSWTGRSISETVVPKYLIPELPSKQRPDDFLFDQDNLLGGGLLVVCEGVFDAMKVGTAFVPGAHGTAFFGKNISAKQIGYLQELSARYDKVVAVFDRDAYADGMSLVHKLQWYVPNAVIRKPDKKDFGATDYKDIRVELKSYM